VKDGRLRGFAVSSLKRSAVTPDLPTMIELGYPGFEAVPWFGLLAPAGTSSAVVHKVYRETLHAMSMTDVRKKPTRYWPRLDRRHTGGILGHDRA